jgi:hypothetical protein
MADVQVTASFSRPSTRWTMSFAWINSFIIVVGNPLAFRFYFRALPSLADMLPAKVGGTCKSQTARNSDEPGGENAN